MVLKEIEDALLGVECHPSSVSSNPQPTTEENACDPLQIIFKRLDDMQGQIMSLKIRNSEVSASIASGHSEEGEALDEDSTQHDTINSKN